MNLLVATVVTAVARALGVQPGRDATAEADYHVEAGDPGVEPMPADTSIPASAADRRRPETVKVE